MITLKSPFKEFIKLCEKENACKEAIVWMKKIDNEGMTSDEGIKAYVKDDLIDDKWAIWVIATIRRDVDIHIAKLFITKIKPGRAVRHIYMGCEDERHEEKDLLREKLGTYLVAIQVLEGSICPPEPYL